MASGTKCYKQKVKMQVQQRMIIPGVHHTTTTISAERTKHSSQSHSCSNSGSKKTSDQSSSCFFNDFLDLHNKSMDTHFHCLPFGLPINTRDVENPAKVQLILAHSLKVQKDEELSDHCAFVTAVVAACLRSIGTTAFVQSGYRNSHDDNEDTVIIRAHMWLLLGPNKKLVDNTYDKSLSRCEIEFLESTYEDGETYRHEKLFIEQEDKHEDRFKENCYLKTIEFAEELPDKAVALGLNNEQLYMYYFRMVRYMWEHFDVKVNIINPCIRYACWHCATLPANSENTLSDIEFLKSVCTSFEKRTTKTSCSGHSSGGKSQRPSSSSKKPILSSRFKHCGNCMVAVYCSTECQLADWTNWHRLVCVSRVAGPASDF